MINSADEAGISLAAIQGLNKKVDELKSQLNQSDADNAKLNERLNRLEQRCF